MPEFSFPPLDEYIASVKKLETRSWSKSVGAQELQIVRSYLLDHYNGVSAVHSYQDEFEEVWDCIPLEQQPTLKKYGLKMAEPPDMEIPELKRDADAPVITTNYDSNKTDPFGNKIGCPPGAIPMKRLRVESILAAGKLRNYLKKDRGMYNKSTKSLTEQLPHLYAVGEQNIQNLGGHSFLNIWQPEVRNGQYFSLSQQWVIGGAGSNRQVMEVGWQVAPLLYKGDPRPYLFIFWTPDDYQSGCYNLEGPGFVQTSNKWMLGYPFQHISQMNGQQFDIEMAWYLMPDRNWWLFINGNKKEDAVGYYPAAIFGSGQLSRFATDIKFGGEVSGATSYPPMGSGQFANNGFRRAAFQRNVSYFSLDRRQLVADLRINQSDAGRYNIQIGSDPRWERYFYFGGPG